MAKAKKAAKKPKAPQKKPAKSAKSTKSAKPAKVAKKKKAPAKKKSAKIRARSKRESNQSRDLPFSIDLSTKINRQRDVAWRLIDGEAVIITPADSTMHTLNDVGTRIWELLTGTRDLKDVAAMLSSEFEVERKRAEQDTLWFVECLAKKGLVEGPDTLDDLDDDIEEEEYAD